MGKVKITVVKKSCMKEFQEKYGHEELGKTCPYFNEGDEFIVDSGSITVPNGFCKSAWIDIARNVYALMLGGNFRDWKWVKDENIGIVCCADGLRPVFFKIEKIK